MSDQEKQWFRVEKLEIRAEDDGPPTVIGRIVPFNKWSKEMFGFMERFEPGAFAELEGSDVIANIEHDRTLAIARTPDTLSIEERKDGLWMTMQPVQTQAARDAVELIRAGVIDGASIEFRVRKGMDQWDVNEEISKRTIPKNGALLEGFALTSRPAYTDTSAALRSLEAWRSEHPTDEQGEANIAAARRRLRLAQAMDPVIDLTHSRT